MHTYTFSNDDEGRAAADQHAACVLKYSLTQDSVAWNDGADDPVVSCQDDRCRLTTSGASVLEERPLTGLVTLPPCGQDQSRDTVWFKFAVGRRDVLQVTKTPCQITLGVSDTVSSDLSHALVRPRVERTVFPELRRPATRPRRRRHRPVRSRFGNLKLLEKV